MQARRRWLGWLATGGLAVGLTLVFWLPIWCGAGFVGGDIYSYFFPQKVIYSESLHAGELPLWNAHAGFGYPLLAESQTGIFYPPNLLLYSWLDAHSAFHVSFLLHYIAAFVFSTMAARRLGLSLLPSWLTALVYVYGWFPPRTCVEWAIIGGTWLPAALWCAESFLASRRWRYAIGLSGVLGVQLLAGHFQIAWFTLLLLVVYVPARAWCFCDNGFRLSALGDRPGTDSREPIAESRSPLSQPRRVTTVAFAAMLCGLGLAAVQLAPTYELKQRSQRATVGKEHELEFGAIPPTYLFTQIFSPSHWYSPLTNREDYFRQDPPLGHARTNSTEAHLFFGLVTYTLFAVWGCWFSIRFFRACTSHETIRESLRQVGSQAMFWLLLEGLSFWYTMGGLLPITRYLPGFSYFQGPGRYGLLTSWSMAMLVGLIVSGRAFSVRIPSAPKTIERVDPPRWLAMAMFVGTMWALVSTWFLTDDADLVASEAGIPHPLVFIGSIVLTANAVFGLLIVGLITAGASAWAIWRSETAKTAWRVLFTLAFVVTTLEFWLISRLVTFTQMVETPPLKSLEQSPVRQQLLEAAKTRPTLRLFAPGANLPSTLGVSSVPIYLTFGPAEYVDDSLRLPDDWMRRGGVTHLLSFDPQPLAESMQLVWQGDDPFLNRAWGRSGQPLYLYEFKQSLGRAQLRALDGQSLEMTAGKLTGFHSQANAVECLVDLNEASVLVLADLDYPGWSVTVDGHAAESLRIDNLFRGVRLEPGSHRVAWSYQPRSVFVGAMISTVTLLMLATAAHVRFWHPQRLAWLDDADSYSQERCGIGEGRNI